MKNLTNLHNMLAVLFTAIILCTNLLCKKPCAEPTITFNTANAEMKAHGDTINVDVTATSPKGKVTSIIVSRSINGVRNPNFISISSLNETTKTIKISDTIPLDLAFDSKIIYTVTVTGDCKENATAAKDYTITIGTSTKVLDKYFYLYENSTAPKIYNRFATGLYSNTGIHFVLLPQKCDRFRYSPISEIDVCDSLNNNTGNPFISNARWGSKNGSKFVKAPGFNWATASSASIVNAYKAGTPSDLINIASNDYIVVNIKNSNRYAVIRVRSMMDDGIASSEDNATVSFIMAQK
jgi:hypothetical protein